MGGAARGLGLLVRMSAPMDEGAPVGMLCTRTWPLMVMGVASAASTLVACSYFTNATCVRVACRSVGVKRGWREASAGLTRAHDPRMLHAAAITLRATPGVRCAPDDCRPPCPVLPRPPSTLLQGCHHSAAVSPSTRLQGCRPKHNCVPLHTPAALPSQAQPFAPATHLPCLGVVNCDVVPRHHKRSRVLPPPTFPALVLWIAMWCPAPLPCLNCPKQPNTCSSIRISSCTCVCKAGRELSQSHGCEQEGAAARGAEHRQSALCTGAECALQQCLQGFREEESCY